MSTEHFDLIVIGSGPAGEKGAAQAAYFGKRVALVEKENHLGGAAANTGTLPSKTLREYACMFAALGVQVTVVEKRGVLVGGMDLEISHALRERMEEDGVRFVMNDSVAAVHCGEAVEVRLESGAEVRADAVLVSSGRCGQTQGLNLEAVGIKTN